MNEPPSPNNPKRSKWAAIHLVIIALGITIAVLGGRQILKCASGGCSPATSLYDDKMRELEKTNPRQIGFTEVLKIPTEFNAARSIALDGKNSIYVAGDTSVRVFSPAGKLLRDMATSEEPYCLAVDSNGDIYVGMKRHVEVYTSKGERIAMWTSPSLKSHFTALVVTEGDVWVADSANRQILRYNKNGTVSGVFARKDPAKKIQGLLVPSPYVDLAAASSGGIWVSNPGKHTVELYASDGSLKRSWGKYAFSIEGFSGCCNPTNIAIMPDGRFVTSEKGIPRVKLYKADGTFQYVVAGREQFATDTAGLDLAVDTHGQIFVLDSSTQSIRIFKEKNKASK